jgi:lysophospholipid acyltransferase (LPLAT)-like uncharacterized protein
VKVPSRWRRRLLRSARLHSLLCWAIAIYIRLVYSTNRWSVEGDEVLRDLHADGRSFIGAFWHGRMLMIPMLWRRRLGPLHMLISRHRDGRIIAGAVGHFGIDTISGSTRRGGSAAMREMLRRLEMGECVGITPDGPRGPAMVASSGIVNLARLAGAPIVPATFATRRRRVLASWDRFHLALPFGRGVFLVGQPIEIPRELALEEVEAARLQVEARLNELSAEADRRVGLGTRDFVADTPALPSPASGGGSKRGQSPRRPVPFTAVQRR